MGPLNTQKQLCVPPAAMRALKGWLIWRYEKYPDEPKPRKIPYYVSGGRRKGHQGSAVDRASLTSFAAARDAAAKRGFDGVGFAPLAEFGIVALDVDNCIDENGHMPDIVKHVASITYCEYSPSGRGIRAFLRGDLGNHKSKSAPGQFGFETFSSSGFVTVTGNMLAATELLGLENTVADVDAPIRQLCSERFGADRQPAGVDGDDPFAGLEQPLGLSIDEMEALLNKIDPDIGRDEWIRVAMALHFETQGDDTGFELFDSWSARGAKYPSSEALRAQWKSFDRPLPKGRRRVTIATVLRLAKLATLRGEPQGAAEDEAKAETGSPPPVDLWRRFDPPSLPEGLLPGAIERFARVQGELMGADPGGLAMSALVVCAAAIPDNVTVQVKKHDRNWTEAPRIWAGLIGPPSAKKSPIMSTATKPLRKLDSKLMRAYKKDLAAYENLPADVKANQPPPVRLQLVLEDTTIEGAQLVLADNPNGVLCMQDELSGWFGSMDKYSGAKGAAKDRAFWLQSWNGGPYIINRVGRGSSAIENLSVALLGGIQPELMRKTIKEAHDDGLIQRLFPILLGPSSAGKDEPTHDVTSEYETLITQLRDVKLWMFDGGVLRFEPGAQEIWRQAEVYHHRLQQMEAVNPKLASHIGKYDGLLARLSVIWHCIENAGAGHLPADITKTTVERAAKFLHGFLLGHAISFYSSVIGLSEDHEHLLDIASYILTHNKSTMTFRDLQRGSQGMKALSRDQAKKIFERLEAFGWVDLEPQPSPNATPRWRVNTAVHSLFEARAHEEKIRRESVRQVMAELTGTKRG